MARIGHNPLNNKPAPHRTSDMVLMAITHLPNTQGYHLHRLEVIKKCLLSMRDNAKTKCDVMIWDNGSCDELRDWLKNDYKPSALVFSENVGKSAGRLGLLGMVTPETIVNISDDDIYYYPDWLSPQIDLLKNIPNVSSVTGYPIRTSFRWATENTIYRMQKAGAIITRGKIMPEQWEKDFCISIGREWEAHKAGTIKDFDIIATYNNRKFFLTSHHCQFVGYAGLLRAAALDTLMLGCMSDEKPFDTMLDKMGNRIATIERRTRHIGNIIDEGLRIDIENAER